MTTTGMEGPLSGRRASLWIESAPPGARDAGGHRTVATPDVDVCIIGAGIAGLTTAILLVEAGASVAVLDAGLIATGSTGHTTAKVTAGHGLQYRRIADQVSDEAAAAHASAQLQAMLTVRRLVREYDIECDLEDVDHYVYAPGADEATDELVKEAEFARALGLPAEHVASVPPPLAARDAIIYRAQIQFHPRRYLLPLADAITRGGGVIFENARVQEITEGVPCTVEAPGVTVRARDVVVATGHPFVHRGKLSARMHVKRSYVLTAPIAPQDMPAGTYLSTEENVHSLRSALVDGTLYAMASGEGHPTGRAGDVPEPERYRRLEVWLRRGLPVGEIAHRWSVQDNYPHDGLPFIGRLSSGRGHIAVATGFSGWGMTNGTIAGRVLAGLLTERGSDWAELYDPDRKPARRTIGALVGINAAAVRDMARDRLRRRPRSADDLGPGEAAVLGGTGGPVAAYRDEDGVLHAVSATCTHMGCVVHWNDAERSWDCPCHGSRFDPQGQVLQAPATAPLADRRWALDENDGQTDPGQTS
jgi:glycine/D-amino acid oxidase-like deaminating enzyme/nitrite reductase/ring-hydroxylating ferredoxin subunit